MVLGCKAFECAPVLMVVADYSKHFAQMEFVVWLITHSYVGMCDEHRHASCWNCCLRVCSTCLIGCSFCECACLPVFEGLEALSIPCRHHLHFHAGY